jgi:hypothetical protein
VYAPSCRSLTLPPEDGSTSSCVALVGRGLRRGGAGFDGREADRSSRGERTPTAERAAAVSLT